MEDETVSTSARYRFELSSPSSAPLPPTPTTSFIPRTEFHKTVDNTMLALSNIIPSKFNHFAFYHIFPVLSIYTYSYCCSSVCVCAMVVLPRTKYPYFRLFIPWLYTSFSTSSPWSMGGWELFRFL